MAMVSVFARSNCHIRQALDNTSRKHAYIILANDHPTPVLKLDFYIVTLEFTGVYIIFYFYDLYYFRSKT